MSHKVEKIHLICTEPRIQEFYCKYLVRMGLFGSYDTIQFANPILALLDPGQRVWMIEQIKSLIALHGAREIALIDHFDCGAYRVNGYKFANFTEELEKHKENNENAKVILKRIFPNITINISYIKIAEDGSCQWFNVSD